ncbi:MAG: 4Fe-4S cluster-binding domain-containing protein [Planctomycetota bacterium]|nr:MAG: 4Fe-4S cluster-binding domain-containing protein [Planctomycetota bacterium]
MKTYMVNEIFFSLQGEGVRAGTPNLFLRFLGCNVECQPNTHGFECDTDYTDGQPLRLDEIISMLRGVDPNCKWVVLTGGEPALQVDRELIDGLHDVGYQLAIETNGTIELPDGLDFITVSPKVAEDQIRQRTADEVKYVRVYGQPIPQTVVEADYKLISPAFKGPDLDRQALEWCIKLVRDNPDWRLSVQMHKFWGIR